MNAARGRTAADSLLDGLEYLVAEALRSRRSDLAEELVRALHAVAAIEERRAGDGPRAGQAPLRLLPSAGANAPPGRAAAPGPAPPSNVVRLYGSHRPARALQLCLEQLRREAWAFRLPFVALVIGVAAEAAREEADGSGAP